MISIGSRQISRDSEPFIIAEVGINHNGNIEKAKEMIKVAKDCNADAVKFQTFKVHELIDDETLTYTYMSQGKEVTETMIDLFTRYEFDEVQWDIIKKECDDIGITFLSTPQNFSDLETLLKLNIEAIKIGSDDFNNLPLIKKYRASGKPLILSCGMADLKEIEISLEVAGYKEGYPLVLLLCISEYPAPVESLNLNRITKLRELFPDLIIGFSDHSQGSLGATLATALGASVIEKHFTLDKNLPGPDHWFSDNPLELDQYIKDIRNSSIALGSNKLEPTSAELEMRKIARRSIVADIEIGEGEVFSEENLSLKRPGNGLAPSFIYELIGKKSKKSFKKGEQIQLGDFH
jgi:N,N'-diacetyllegionaminate synthase